MLWDLEQAPEMLRWYQDFILNAPQDLSGFFAFMTVPPAPPFPEELHLKKMCGIVWCYLGPHDKADTVFAPVRKAHPPKLDLVGPIPHPMLQSMFDGLYPAGLQWYWKADFFKQIPNEAIGQAVEFAKQLPSMWSTMHLYPIDGAAHRVSNQATAWGHRDANFASVIVGVDPDPKKLNGLREWARGYWQALHPHSSGGAYLNFLMPEGEEPGGDDQVRASYGSNYDRLAEIKAKYDPQNLFHINQNIKPK